MTNLSGTDATPSLLDPAALLDEILDGCALEPSALPAVEPGAMVPIRLVLPPPTLVPGQSSPLTLDPRSMITVTWKVYNRQTQAQENGQTVPTYADADKAIRGTDYDVVGDPSGLAPVFTFAPPLDADKDVYVVATVLARGLSGSAAKDVPKELSATLTLKRLDVTALTALFGGLLKLELPDATVPPGGILRPSLVPRGAEDTEFIVKTASMQAKPVIDVDATIDLDPLLVPIQRIVGQASRGPTLALYDVAASLAALHDPVDRVAATLGLLGEPVDRVASVLALLGDPVDRVAASIALLSEPVDRVAAATALAAFPLDRIADVAALIAFPLDKLATATALVSEPVERLGDAVGAISVPTDKIGQAIALLAEPVASAVEVLGALSKPAGDIAGAFGVDAPELDLDVDLSALRRIQVPAIPVGGVASDVRELLKGTLDVSDMRALLRRILSAPDLREQVRSVMAAPDFQDRVSRTLDRSDFRRRMEGALDRTEYRRKMDAILAANGMQGEVQRVLGDRAVVSQLQQEALADDAVRGNRLPIRVRVVNEDFTKNLVRREDEDPLYKAQRSRSLLPEVPSLPAEMRALDDIPADYRTLQVGTLRIPFTLTAVEWAFSGDKPGLMRLMAGREFAWMEGTGSRKLGRSVAFQPSPKDMTRYLRVKITFRPGIPGLQDVVVTLPEVPVLLRGLDLAAAVGERLEVRAPGVVAAGAPLVASLASPLLSPADATAETIAGTLPFGEHGPLPFTLTDVTWKLLDASGTERGTVGPGSGPSALRAQFARSLPTEDETLTLACSATLTVPNPWNNQSTFVTGGSVTLPRTTVVFQGLDVVKLVTSSLRVQAPARVPAGGDLVGSLSSPFFRDGFAVDGTLAGAFPLPGRGAPIPLRIENVRWDLTEADGSPVTARDRATPGLRAWWPLDEGSGTTILDVANGFNGTVTKGTWTEGPLGKALVFAKQAQPVRIPAPADLRPAQAFTLVMWARSGATLQTPSGQTAAVPLSDCFTEDTQSEPAVLLGVERLANGSPTWVAKVRTLGAPGSQPATTSLEADPRRFASGRWQHLALTYSPTGKRVRLYVDGVAGSAVSEGGLAPGAADYLLGKLRDADSPLALQDVRLHARELAPDEVKARFLGGPEDVKRRLTVRLTLVVGPSGDVVPSPITKPIRLGPMAVRFGQAAPLALLRAALKVEAPASVEAGLPIPVALVSPGFDASQPGSGDVRVSLPLDVGSPTLPLRLTSITWNLLNEAGAVIAPPTEDAVASSAATGGGSVTTPPPQPPALRTSLKAPFAKDDARCFVQALVDVQVDEGPGIVPRSWSQVPLPRVPVRVAGFDLLTAVKASFSLQAPARVHLGEAIAVSLASPCLPETQPSANAITGAFPLPAAPSLAAKVTLTKVTWALLDDAGASILTTAESSSSPALGALLAPPILESGAIRTVRASFTVGVELGSVKDSTNVELKVPVQTEGLDVLVDALKGLLQVAPPGGTLEPGEWYEARLASRIPLSRTLDGALAGIYDAGPVPVPFLLRPTYTLRDATDPKAPVALPTDQFVANLDDPAAPAFLTLPTFEIIRAKPSVPAARLLGIQLAVSIPHAPQPSRGPMVGAWSSATSPLDLPAIPLRVAPIRLPALAALFDTPLTGGGPDKQRRFVVPSYYRGWLIDEWSDLREILGQAQRHATRAHKAFVMRAKPSGDLSILCASLGAMLDRPLDPAAKPSVLLADVDANWNNAGSRYLRQLDGGVRSAVCISDAKEITHNLLIVWPQPPGYRHVAFSYADGWPSKTPLKGAPVVVIPDLQAGTPPETPPPMLSSQSIRPRFATHQYDSGFMVALAFDDLVLSPSTRFDMGWPIRDA